MIRISAAFLLTLPVAAVFTAAPALAQLPPPGVYEERLPPVMGGYDEDEDGPPRAGRWSTPRRAVPDPDDDANLPPPRFFRTPDGRAVGYGHQFDPQVPQQGQPQQVQPQQQPAGAPSRANNDPDALRPPGAIGATPQGQSSSTTASLPPEDQPETGQPKELPPSLKKQLVDYGTKEPAGTIIIDTQNTYLYLVLGGGKALRYGIGVGRDGFTWAGTERISRMSEWPDWHPPSEMIDRQPYLPRFMAGGPGNPLGARALYLGKTLYRIHGTNQPSTIGSFVSSGCIRLINADIEDLFSRVQVGTRVVVLPGKVPDHVANTGVQPPVNALAPPGAAPAATAPASAGVAPRNNGTAISSSPLPPIR